VRTRTPRPCGRSNATSCRPLKKSSSPFSWADRRWSRARHPCQRTAPAVSACAEYMRRRRFGPRRRLQVPNPAISAMILRYLASMRPRYEARICRTFALRAGVSAYP
jgi:hypothetical protein